MKVAYVFSTSGHTASYKLGKMILPQLESDSHGAEVVGMFFFDDNTYVLREGDPLGARLSRVAEEKGILLRMCDQCALERELAFGVPGDCEPKGTVPGAKWAVFPICMPPFRAIHRTRSLRSRSNLGEALDTGLIIAIILIRSWKDERPEEWVFLGDNGPISVTTSQQQRYKKEAGREPSLELCALGWGRKLREVGRVSCQHFNS